ncbi:unnamed protein product [Caenorhabditis nigoni]
MSDTSDKPVMAANSSDGIDEMMNVNPPGSVFSIISNLMSTQLAAGLTLMAIAAPEVAPILLTVAAIGLLVKAVGDGVEEVVEEKNKEQKEEADRKAELEKQRKMEEELEAAQKRLREIHDQFQVLAIKTREELNELKELMVEMQFDDETMLPVFVLMRYMYDCINNPDKAADQNFARVYEKHNPLELTYTVMGLLDQDVTNPLKIAMNCAPLPSKTEFKKYENVVSTVLGHLMILEAFASGMGLSNQENVDLIHKTSFQILESIANMEKEYMDGAECFKRLETYLPDFQLANKELSNMEKCEKLKKLLEEAMTA